MFKIAALLLVLLVSSMLSPASLSVNLYFPEEGSFLLVPEIRSIKGDSPLAVVNALLAGPTTPGLITLLPEGVRVLALTVRDNTAHLDFSAEFNNVNYGSGPEAAMLGMVVNTLTELEGIAAVYITVEGNTPECFKHIGSSGPFTWSGALLKNT